MLKSLEFMFIWFLGNFSFIVIKFVFMNNMLGLILYMFIRFIIWNIFSNNKIVQILLYVILFHSFFYFFFKLVDKMSII